MIRGLIFILLFFLLPPLFSKMVSVPGGAFSIDIYEVTNAQYQKCVAAGVCTAPHYDDGLGHYYDGKGWPAGVVPASFQSPELPVVCVDWYAAKKFCEFSGKRLPTEAEWEKAVVAGSVTRYFWGEALDTSFVWSKENSGLTSHAVGQKKPNSLGLYDMCGNVWEWCQDDFNDSLKVFRGGSWVNDSASVLVRARKGAPPLSAYNNNGFRCVK